MNQITAMLLKGAAEGKYGATIKAIYWKVDGHKTQAGAVLAVPGVILLGLDQAGVCSAFALDCGHWMTQWGAALTVLGGIGIHVGQVGGGLKLESPKK